MTSFCCQKPQHNQAHPHSHHIKTGVNSSIPRINTTGGQCSWCGIYGHRQSYCPYLK
ncbi:hypothetical protein BC941DRAFT_434098 [Chlamydoabsidia padenii]|nr:hypothetical protein BC941DRAFT_434098 [Chlamydoabsidia padenii]